MLEDAPARNVKKGDLTVTERNTNGRRKIGCWRRILGLALVVFPPFARGKRGVFLPPGLMSPAAKNRAGNLLGCFRLARSGWSRTLPTSHGQQGETGLRGRGVPDQGTGTFGRGLLGQSRGKRPSSGRRKLSSEGGPLPRAPCPNKGLPDRGGKGQATGQRLPFGLSVCSVKL